MEVLKRWPLDKTKGGRDYGLYLRNLAKSAFPAGQVFTGNDVSFLRWGLWAPTVNDFQLVVEEKYDALFRLADNKYKKMYASSRTTAATGLTHDQLHHAMSEEFVSQYLRQNSLLLSGFIKWKEFLTWVLIAVFLDEDLELETLPGNFFLSPSGVREMWKTSTRLVVSLVLTN